VGGVGYRRRRRGIRGNGAQARHVKGNLHVRTVLTHRVPSRIAAPVLPLRNLVLVLRLREPPFHLGPVDHVPPRLEVGGPLVLVLEVVRVLPDVYSQNREVALHDRRVLVGRGVEGAAYAVPDEPRPAAAAPTPPAA